MQETKRSDHSKRNNIPSLPLIPSDHKLLPTKINNYLTEVNQELLNLERAQYGESYSRNITLTKIKHSITYKKKESIRKSCQILPVVQRLSSMWIKPLNQIEEKEHKKKAQTTTSLPNPCTKSSFFSKIRLLQELKSIDEESASVNNNLLTHIENNADTQKKFKNQFKKIHTLKKRLILDSDEFLQPELSKPFQEKHTNDFYTNLDQVIKKIKGKSTIDLYKKMKMLNDEKENVNYASQKTQKQVEKVEKILHDTHQIRKSIMQQYQ